MGEMKQDDSVLKALKEHTLLLHCKKFAIPGNYMKKKLAPADSSLEIKKANGSGQYNIMKTYSFEENIAYWKNQKNAKQVYSIMRSVEGLVTVLQHALEEYVENHTLNANFRGTVRYQNCPNLEEWLFAKIRNVPAVGIKRVFPQACKYPKIEPIFREEEDLQ